LWALVTWLPLALSVATFFLPSGFFLRRFALGARTMSQREREALERVREAFAQTNPSVNWPSHVYILDKQGIESFVIGTTLYLSRPLVQSEYLAPQVAHALSHVNSLDGRLVLALRRLVFTSGIFSGPLYWSQRAWCLSSDRDNRRDRYRVRGPLRPSGGSPWPLRLLAVVLVCG
jgi:hypothetical protein